MTEPYPQDDQFTLYHGDCREIREWLAADVLVTDPPYGLGKRMSAGPRRNTLWGKSDGGAAPLPWDSEAPEWVTALTARFEQVIIWGGNYFDLPPSRCWLIWDKINRQFSSADAELAWTNLDRPVRAFNYASCQLATEGKFHPTQKPLPLMQWCLGFTAGVVADPFAGAGTTLIAARNLGRKAIGVEIEERYCELIASRLTQGCLDFGEVS